MTSERMNELLNELLNDPFSHRLPTLVIATLAGALSFVVQATGEAGAQALETYCADREKQDEGGGIALRGNAK